MEKAILTEQQASSLENLLQIMSKEEIMYEKADPLRRLMMSGSHDKNIVFRTISGADLSKALYKGYVIKQK